MTRPGARGARHVLAAALFAIVATAGPAAAGTLLEALALAYTGNPALAAQRERLRATDELLAQAQSGYRPSVVLEGDVGVETVDTDRTSSDTLAPGGVALSVVQPLYRGGRTTAEVARARSLIRSERSRYFDVEQLILLEAVTVYVAVVRDEAVHELARNNEAVIGRQLDATRDRFEVGEVTRTDVAQAEARLAGAVADRVSAEGDVVVAAAAFLRVIGAPPEALETAEPLAGMPADEAEAQAVARTEHPAVVAAEFAEEAARHDIRAAESDLLPELRLRGSLERGYDRASAIARDDSASIRAEVTIPLYEAGFTHSVVRENRLRAAERRLQTDQARLDVAENVTRAWEQLVTARARIAAFEEAVRAAEIALDGLEREAQVGSRTVLDVLDGEQELFQARVDLVRAESDLVVATYAVQAAEGRLTARNLGLPVALLDVEAYTSRIDGAWWGTAVE
ncbi:MAG: TolC family outer membrane protein [Alphaproteobacteria bacterium]